MSSKGGRHNRPPLSSSVRKRRLALVLACLLASGTGITIAAVIPRVNGPVIPGAKSFCQSSVVPAYFPPEPGWTQAYNTKPAPGMMILDITGSGAGTSPDRRYRIAVEQAKADTIDFSQFGPQNTQLNSPITGTTTSGVGVTLTSPIGSFFTRVEGDSWQGIFPSGAALLWDGDHSGVVSLTFATPIQSLTLAAQADAAGPFVQTMQAFDAGSTLLDTKTSPTINNCQDLSCEGTHAFLTVVGLNITRVDVSVSHDSSGFALYGGAGVNPVPIPGALPLFAGGLGLISLLAKRKSRKGAAAFASAA